MFLRVQLTINQHWFRQSLGAEQVTSHCLNQCWSSLLTYICGTRERRVNSLAGASLVKLPSDECYWTLMMVSQHWFMWWLGSHYLSHNWPRSMSSYGVTRPQWVSCGVHTWSLLKPRTFHLTANDLYEIYGSGISVRHILDSTFDNKYSV